MVKKDADRNTSDAFGDTSSHDDLQVRYRLRTLVELAISIGRRKGMFKGLPPLEEDKLNIEPSDKEGQ